MKHNLHKLVWSIGMLLSAVFLMVNTAHAQDRRVTGRVLSGKDQQPVPGTSILVKNSQVGTTTDADGNFSLNVTPNATLVFSAIGFAGQEIKVGNQSQINVTLRETDQNLDEVVVTALGIKKETKTLGYATATLGSDQINVNRQPNFMNALQGKMAGVQISGLGTGPASTSKIRIRGQSSFSGQNSPLIVVNGVPIDNTNFSINSGNNGSDASVGNRGFNNSDGGDGLSSINPDDIEQMTVLKGATAAALYGSRAKDGVIMITTKTKGTSAGIGVTYNSNMTIEQPLDFTDYQYEYGQGENGVRPTTPNPTSGVWSWGERFQPGMTQVLFGGVTVPYEPVRNRIRQFYRNGLNWTNTIQLSTSGEKGGMTISASNLDSKGITPNNTFKRQSINFGFNYNVVPKLNVSGTINYSYEDNRNPPQIAQQDFTIPTVLYTMANSMPFDVMEANRYDADGNEFVWSRFRNRTNPYFTLSDKFEKIQRDRVFGNVALRYNFTDWLYVQGRIGQDYWSRNQNYNFPTGSAAQAPAPAGFANGWVVQETRRSREVNADFLIGANRNIGKIGVDVLLGGNQLYRYGDNNSVFAQDFVVRGLYTPQNARIKDPTYNFSERKVNSLYAQVGLSYNDYLFLNATARNDWFSTLAPGNRSILYPSVTGSFVFSQAFNNAMPDWITFGKLRAAYAEVGSDTDVPPYANGLFYGVNANLFQGQPVGFISGNRVPNTDLKPMRVAETEFGLEMKFLNNRIGFDVAYYNKITSDQIVAAQISTGSGYFDQLINSGQSQSRGIELLLTGSPARGANFSWDISFNAAYNETKLLRLLTDDDGTPEKDYDKNGQPAQIVTGGGVFIGELRQVVGRPLGQIYSFPLLRNAQGQLIHTASGLPQRGPQQISFGSALPRWFGGVTNTFNYKGINLSFLIDYRLGNQMISGTNRNAIRHGLHQMTLVGRDSPNYLMTGAGVGPNGEPNTARVNAQIYYETMVANSTGEAVVYNGGFIKLRQVSLGYDFTRFLPKTMFIKGLRLSAVSNNVLLLKKWVDNIDPEQFGFSSDNVVGLEATGVPTTRSIGFNLNARF
ncbi:SusC/RagA family TonB-linked outer membrane protein [Spirosoma montaniterrae]|uniref:SusC/RagA family TonB-linked outer membrane protein n=1 Tax=Spirosoma montaniterrae TaxID=1178516 RepID=A0A1P9WZ44_9BACT|nr:SusC/RagA family TonB-linked outer membrane protein [Spirosoma montaniterrae]AQG80633.1 SusC/RagA family TonB-linked outer membrane protein [Spirosoma montaniterrae]